MPVTERGLTETIQNREQCEVRIFSISARHRPIPVNKRPIDPAGGEVVQRYWTRPSPSTNYSISIV